MIRIAKVKFGSGSKRYDYFCPDTSIVEGDIVYVEEKEQPLLISEIVEESNSNCRATKKVLRKAKENPDVVLESKYINITKCDCDCIVNSLGPQTDVFGAICKSIVETAKSDDINNMLKEHPSANIFEMFVTDSGVLPSKHVIHIVMPFKYEDNHNSNLKKAFSLVIDKAISLGFESIGIPYIGTGANGYEKEDIADALNSILFEYQYKDNIKIKIVSIVYNTIGDHARFQDEEFEAYSRGQLMEYTNHLRHMHDRNENIYYDDNIKLSTVVRDESIARPNRRTSSKKESKKSYYYADSKTQFILEAYENCYNPEDEFELDEKVDNPVDYIRVFKKKNKDRLFKVSADFQVALSYPNQTKVSSGERQIKKNEVINLAIACKMNFTEFIQFMFFSGFSISTHSNNDIELELLKYLIKHKKFNGLALTYNEIASNVGNDAVGCYFPQ
ncbi:MAG: macro domain-containing protein [Anaeroplasma sp.]|nr:macro domain-containing protein [Anaeroplasma sp.]